MQGQVSLCFDVSFPAGGVTDCRTRSVQERFTISPLFTYRQVDVSMVTMCTSWMVV